MNLEVRGVNLPLTDAVVGHVEQRLGAALHRFARRVRAVTVRVMDINGTRGGTDKRVEVEIDLEGSGAVRVEQMDADVYDAVTRASHRVKRTVSRSLERFQTQRQKR